MIPARDGRRVVIVPCTVEIEQTPQSFHAHAVPELDLRPGDVVLVHGAPTHVRFGESVTRHCQASVRRAGPVRRTWTRLTALLELTNLYEVGFEPQEEA